MTQQVAGEEAARLDLALLEPRGELAARERSGFADREHEAERRGLGPGIERREDEELLVAPDVFAHDVPVLTSRRDEARQLLELLAADRGLQIERLQVVADVLIGVLVVEPERERAELVAEALAARVVLAGLAPAVAAPVAERAGDPVQLAARGEHRPALAGRHLVRGIEGERREIAERADGLPVDARAESVAAVLDEEHAALAAQRRDRRRVVGEAHRVREDDGAGALRYRGARGSEGGGARNCGARRARIRRRPSSARPRRRPRATPPRDAP